MLSRSATATPTSGSRLSSSFDSGAKGAVAQDDVGGWGRASRKSVRHTERSFHVITWTSQRSVRICHGLTVGPPIHELGGTKCDCYSNLR